VISPDAPVPEETKLYRRVHPTQLHWDDNDGCLRPTSSAFKGEEMSIGLGDVLEDEQRDIESLASDKPTHSLVSLTAGYVEGEEDQQVRRTPLQEEPAHGDVCGEKTQGRRKRFAFAAELALVREDELKAADREKLKASRKTGSSRSSSPE
jgi:hypothetical protein